MSVLHTPVLLTEAVRWLRIKPGGTYVDATLGTGGHALEIARHLTTGKLIGFDRDQRALEIAERRLKEQLKDEFEQRVMLVHESFSHIDEVARERNLPAYDGVLADLGVSTLELDSVERGFSFRAAGPLDMRMNANDPLTAADIVNHWAERDLANLLYEKGEERDSRRIARAIVRARPIRDTAHLATVVAGARKARGRQKLHPATKTFLALRTAVNRESEELEQFLSRTPATLSFGARWVVLSYHSLEDRLVKRAFQVLEKSGGFRVLTRRVETPGEGEVRANPRARSAKMRVIEKVSEINPAGDFENGPDESSAA